MPYEQEFELYHNAFSLCSMKSRLCLSELGIPYRSHPVDLIETGAYENIRAGFLRVNPAGTVPVLVHEGHPVYESHEQIRYAAEHAPSSHPGLIPDDPEARERMQEWVDRSSLTKDPINEGDLSAGNAVPGLTLPIFATMMERIPAWRVIEGLLFHFDKRRPVLFLMLKLRGVEGLPGLGPLIAAHRRSRRQMAAHLDALERCLEESGGPWILGSFFSLADVSWLVIFERLAQVESLGVFRRRGPSASLRRLLGGPALAPRLRGGDRRPCPPDRRVRHPAPARAEAGAPGASGCARWGAARMRARGAWIGRFAAVGLAGWLSVSPTLANAEATARIVLRVTHNGEPTRAQVVATDSESEESLAESLVTGEGPAILSLRAGVVRIHVRALAIHGETDHFFDDLRLAPGAEVRLAHDFESGVLNVRATLRSEPVDARVEVRDARGEVVARDTIGGDDRDLILTPGTYRVVVSPLRGREGDERAARVEIEPRGIEVIDLELRPGLPQEAR